MKESIYEIRYARLDEGDAVRRFYRKFWNKDHVLVKSKELFDFQHNIGEYYTIIIAYNKQTGEIDGTWGTIPFWQYDEKLKQYGDCGGAILKIRDDVENREIRALFMRFYRFVFKNPDIKGYMSSGLGEIGYKVMAPLCKNKGLLNHYYVVNNNINDFRIAINPEKTMPISNSTVIREIKLNEVTDAPSTSYRPIKSINYFRNRFELHPIYKYRFLGFYKENRLLAIWAIRFFYPFEDVCAIRVVDCFGRMDNIGCIHKQLQEYLIDNNAEYIDFLNAGIPEAVFLTMGFSKLDYTQNDAIIPNYTEPLVRSLVPIYYAYNSKTEYVVFRADCDQDRPNIL